MLRTSRVFLCGSIALVAIAAPCFSASFYVSQSAPSSGDGTSWATAFKTIAQGIAAAQTGDEVIVAEGTYTEVVDFSGKNITVRSCDPDNSSVVGATVIEPFGAPAAVRFRSGETREAVLAGFTISSSQTGVSCEEASPIIRRNVIVGNAADFDKGGGISCYLASPLIEHNIIAANRASQGGGGIACDGGLPVVRRNLLIQNVSDFHGGGILVVNCTAHVSHNRIIANSSRGDGGGIASITSQLHLTNNLISSNHSTATGGGLGGTLSIVTLTANTIAGNSATSGAGGVSLSLSSPTLRNSILWGNGQDLDGVAATYSCIEDTSASGDGNIHDNPRFTDPAGLDHTVGTEDDDYTLAGDSPCRDRGFTPAAIPLHIARTPTLFLLSWDPGTDVAGNPRLSGTAVDIGAYEYQNFPPSYLLESSHDMISWSPAYVGLSSSASFEDSVSTRFSFYRVSSQIPPRSP